MITWQMFLSESTRFCVVSKEYLVVALVSLGCSDTLALVLCRTEPVL